MTGCARALRPHLRTGPGWTGPSRGEAHDREGRKTSECPESQGSFEKRVPVVTCNVSRLGRLVSRVHGPGLLRHARSTIHLPREGPGLRHGYHRVSYYPSDSMAQRRCQRNTDWDELGSRRVPGENLNFTRDAGESVQLESRYRRQSSHQPPTVLAQRIPERPGQTPETFGDSSM